MPKSMECILGEAPCCERIALGILKLRNILVYITHLHSVNLPENGISV